MRSVGLVLRIVDSCQLLNLSLRIVGNNYLHRVENSTHADSTAIQIISNCTFQQRHLVESIVGGISNLINEFDDTFGAVATTTESTDGRHTRIVPTINQTLIHQC